MDAVRTVGLTKTKTTAKTGKLSIGEKFTYGLGDCAANIYVALGGAFLTGFYTDTAGIAAAAVATMMLVTRVLDGATDLIMGAVVDKTKSRFGKARPWLLWTAPLMMIALILLFTVPQDFSDGGKLVYAYLTYIFMNCIVYTANNLPYNALLSRMTLDVQERAKTASLRFIMTSVTTIIINAITPLLIPKIGWVSLAVIYGAIEFVLLIISFLGCKEHIGEDANGKVELQQVPLKQALLAVLTNRYFYLQALLFAVLYIGVVSSGSLGYYYFNSVLGNLALMSVMSFSSIPTMLVNVFVPTLVRKFGKRKPMMIGCLVMAAGSILMGLAGANVPLLFIGAAIKGAGMGPIMSGIFALTADIVDYGEWKTGIRSEGLINSCTSFGMKVGIGLGSAAAGWILAFGGYNGLATSQTESALSAIRFGYGYFGAIVAIACFIILMFMNIDRYLPEIQKDLQAKHA